MKTIGIFYGSSTGNTQHAAELIANKLGVGKSNIFDIGSSNIEKLSEYDILFLGSSTWGIGELQNDWEGLIGKLEKQNLAGKKIAVFGLGDSSSYPDSFCDAIGILAKASEKAGGELIGNDVDPSDYSFDDSQAIINDKFCGLPLDADNEDNQTDSRVNNWLEQIKSEINL